MKLKLKDIVESVSSFEKLVSKNISFKANYRISKLILEINKELETYEKVKTQIFQKYGENVEIDGKKHIRISTENLEKFDNEMSSVLSEEVDLKYEQIDIDDLVFFEDGVKKEDSIPVENMMILAKFFKSKDE